MIIGNVEMVAGKTNNVFRLRFLSCHGSVAPCFILKSTVKVEFTIQSFINHGNTDNRGKMDFFDLLELMKDALRKPIRKIKNSLDLQL